MVEIMAVEMLKINRTAKIFFIIKVLKLYALKLPIKIKLQ